MGSTTPFYAFPYPVGTDRVTDGDNAMQALAEKMEAVLKGTAPSGPRTWTSRLGTNTPIGAGSWIPVQSVALTSCPVGAVVLVIVSTGVSSSGASVVLQTRLTCAGATLAPTSAAGFVNQGTANAWSNVGLASIAVVTVAAPSVVVEVFGGSGTTTVEASSHMTAVRVV